MCFALNKAFPRHVFYFPPCEMSAVLGFANENLGKLVQVILQACRKPSHMKIGSFGTEIGVVRPSRKREKKILEHHGTGWHVMWPVAGLRLDVRKVCDSRAGCSRHVLRELGDCGTRCHHGLLSCPGVHITTLAG